MQSEYLVIFTSSLTLIVSLLVFMLKVCFKSKCADVNFCWGFLKVHRNTIEEEKNISMSDVTNRSTVSPV
jgi:hypothetical protein